MITKSRHRLCSCGPIIRLEQLYQRDTTPLSGLPHPPQRPAAIAAASGSKALIQLTHFLILIFSSDSTHYSAVLLPHCGCVGYGLWTVPIVTMACDPTYYTSSRLAAAASDMGSGASQAKGKKLQKRKGEQKEHTSANKAPHSLTDVPHAFFSQEF